MAVSGVCLGLLDALLNMQHVMFIISGFGLDTINNAESH